MRKIGQKLLLTSFFLAMGLSSASSGIMRDSQKSGDSIGQLRGTVEAENWQQVVSHKIPETDTSELTGGYVFIPDVVQIQRLAQSSPVLDDQGYPLDMVATGSIGKSVKKTVVWERFNSRGSSLRDKFSN